MAEYEHYVADFYFRRKLYLSAAFRYSALLQEYGNLGYDEEGLLRLGKCYINTRMYSNAREALKTLVNRFPKSEWRAEADRLLGDLTTKN